MHRLAQRLVSWYRKNRILYPWRRTRDPYAVWVSEILLQQTRISVALPFYDRILLRYPTVRALAAAESSDFLALWSGIGYYRRAEHMLLCAREIEKKHGGKFPDTLPDLLALPGIGKYTAGALRNLCFDQLTPAIDGNVARVLARISGCDALYGSKPFQNSIESVFLQTGAEAPPADYFQSLMELGEQICGSVPRCAVCPVSAECVAYKSGSQPSLPKMPKTKKQTDFHWHFLVLRDRDRCFYVQNPSRGFLKNAWLFPDVLSKAKLSGLRLEREFNDSFGLQFKRLAETGTIKHAVTFRNITCHIHTAEWTGKLPAGGLWLNEKELRLQHTSSVVHKILSKRK